MEFRESRHLPDISNDQRLLVTMKGNDPGGDAIRLEIREVLFKNLHVEVPRRTISGLSFGKCHAAGIFRRTCDGGFGLEEQDFLPFRRARIEALSLGQNNAILTDTQDRHPVLEKTIPKPAHGLNKDDILRTIGHRVEGGERLAPARGKTLGFE